MKSEKFEEWFDVAFDQAASSTSLTSEESKKASWSKVQARIQEVNRARKRRRHLQLGGVVAASFIAGAILFSPPGVSKAVSPLIDSIVDMGNGVVSIIFNNGNEPTDLLPSKTPAPPSKDEEYRDPSLDSTETGEAKTQPLSEVQAALSFPLPDLHNIPEGFQFKESVTTLEQENHLFDKVALLYTDKDNQLLWINLKRMKPFETTGSSGSDETKQIKLNNGYDIYYTPGSLNELIMNYNGLLLQISGKISKEEMINIIEGFSDRP